jgi:hypothetical protein
MLAPLVVCLFYYLLFVRNRYEALQNYLKTVEQELTQSRASRQPETQAHDERDRASNPLACSGLFC